MNKKIDYKYEKNLENFMLASDNLTLVLPFFEQLDYQDLLKIRSLNSLIDPLISIWKENSSSLQQICRDTFNKDIFFNNGFFYLNDKVVEPHQRMVIQIIYENLMGRYKSIKAVIPKKYNINISPFYYDEYLTKLDVSLEFISDDDVWISIFNKEISFTETHWVESSFDLFTYNFFSEGNYRIASGWMNIVNILRMNNKHTGIIDKDGFTTDSKNSSLYPPSLKICRYTECENIWLSENILDTFSLLNRNFNKKEIIKSVINYSEKDFQETFTRFLKRQSILEQNNLPFISNQKTEKLFEDYFQNIKNRNYNKIIEQYDNKKMFNLLLKELSCNNISSFYSLLNKNKKQFKNMNIKIFL